MGGTAKGRPAFPRVPVRRDRPSPKRCPLFPRRNPFGPGLGSSPRNDDTDARLLLQAAGRNPPAAAPGRRSDERRGSRAALGGFVEFPGNPGESRRFGRFTRRCRVAGHLSRSALAGWTRARPGEGRHRPPGAGTGWSPGEWTGCPGNRLVGPRAAAPCRELRGRSEPSCPRASVRRGRHSGWTAIARSSSSRSAGAHRHALPSSRTGPRRQHRCYVGREAEHTRSLQPAKNVAGTHEGSPAIA